MSRRVGFGAVGSRETTTDELRAKARERVLAAARRGEKPREFFSPDDLAWARITPDELDALDQQAQEAIDERAQGRRERDRRQELRYVTDQVLNEWDAQRRREAEAEARLRLGWEDGKA